jgi:capsid assembly protease
MEAIMLLERVINNLNKGAWFIRPDSIHSLVLAAKELDSKIDDKMILAFGQETESPDDDEDYPIEDGCAIISIIGATQKRCDWYDKLMGCVSTDEIKAKISNALESPLVKSILLFIDSPGGTVDGTRELSDFIFDARGKKPIVAYTNGCMCSAAYHYGSSCDKIIAVPGADVGSIGVYCTHYDISGFYESMGIKASIIKAGKYKAVGNQLTPLSEEDRAVMQQRIDSMYAEFTATVARNRGVDISVVLSEMAEGQVFNSADALSKGMIDEVNYIEKISGYFEANSITQTKDDSMKFFGDSGKVTADQLKEKNAELYGEVFEAGKVAGKAETDEANKEAVATAKKEATEAEKARVAGIFELASSSQVELAIKMVAEGSSVEDAKTALLKDAQATKAEALKEFNAGAASDVNHTAEAATNDTARFVEKFENDKTFAGLYTNKGGKDALIKALGAWSSDAKARESFNNDIEVFLAYERNTKK